MKIDFTSLGLFLTVIILAALASFSGYRLEIGQSGLKFEGDASKAALSQKM